MKIVEVETIVVRNIPPFSRREPVAVCAAENG